MEVLFRDPYDVILEAVNVAIPAGMPKLKKEYVTFGTPVGVGEQPYTQASVTVTAAESPKWGWVGEMTVTYDLIDLATAYGTDELHQDFTGDTLVDGNAVLSTEVPGVQGLAFEAAPEVPVTDFEGWANTLAMPKLYADTAVHPLFLNATNCTIKVRADEIPQ